jgi:hypothetical protein
MSIIEAKMERDRKRLSSHEFARRWNVPKVIKLSKPKRVKDKVALVGKDLCKKWRAKITKLDRQKRSVLVTDLKGDVEKFKFDDLPRKSNLKVGMTGTIIYYAKELRKRPTFEPDKES